MNVQDIPISDIIIGERRREDFGDLQELADSIAARGLLQAIVVDIVGDKFKLAAGERRIRAFQILGRTEIPARIFAELSDDERREIELEENLLRKDLTPYEQSKQLVALADVAAKVLETEENEFPSTIDEKSEPARTEDSHTSKRGRPAKPVTEDKVAERIGIPRSTIHNAKAHVEAVTKHPDLKDSTQKEAIQTAREREPVKPKSNLKPLTKPLSKPGGSQSSQFNKWNTKVREFKSELNGAGGAENLAGAWQETDRFTFFDNLKELRDVIDAYLIDLGEHLNDMKDASGF